MELLNAEQLAAELGIALPTLWEWKRKGRLPPSEPLPGRVLRWRRSAIEDWRAGRLASHGPAGHQVYDAMDLAKLFMQSRDRIVTALQKCGVEAEFTSGGTSLYGASAVDALRKAFLRQPTLQEAAAELRDTIVKCVSAGEVLSDDEADLVERLAKLACRLRDVIVSRHERLRRCRVATHDLEQEIETKGSEQ